MATILSRKPGGSGGGGGGAPSGPAGGDLTGTYPNPTLVANAVETAAIQNGAVTAAKVAADVATQAELDAVAAAAVNDGDAAGGVLSGTYPNPGFAADMATQAELDAHINDPTDAHDASAISFAPTGTIAATDVQAAIAEAVSEALSRGSLYQYVVLT